VAEAAVGAAARDPLTAALAPLAPLAALAAAASVAAAPAADFPASHAANVIVIPASMNAVSGAFLVVDPTHRRARATALRIPVKASRIGMM
jgi:hypothetical protein